ncbi:hypothetical protein BJY00DRAFT_297314 [Aspergillus carlsbadensis]|nr:hypothetical protein BJY00DRAFT_297314 [Aspergillus carlsbadensis]
MPSCLPHRLRARWRYLGGHNLQESISGGSRTNTHTTPQRLGHGTDSHLRASSAMGVCEPWRLNQHLNSLIHMQHVRHCPNARCAKAFAALIGPLNHLESKSCSFILFGRLRKSIGAVIGSGQWIEV